VSGALGTEGVVAAMGVEAATGTPVLLASLRQALVPEPVRTEPGAVVVMDDLAPHRAAAVGAILEQAGLRWLCLPRYSPELSPIEPCWSKIETLLRAPAARAIDALGEALGAVLDTISAQDAHGWLVPPLRLCSQLILKPP
jgi:transposase